ncbi:uncharacterized protein [Linepithema humile]|uniref:uncharacterized protein n=1 Tax=Linepithema humile TaxID=83485 RepID=UPI00062308AD|nr:PREDICTED: uncharacterized protein LOC105678886 [Linepithema humile]
MFSNVIKNSMTLLINTIIGLFILADVSLANLNTQGVKCGTEKYCNILEYCSTYDNHCRSCAIACDVNSHNSEPEECAQKCQVYLQDLQDQRYDDLRAEVAKLKINFTVVIVLICFSLLGILYLLGRTLFWWERIQKFLRALFRNNLIKAANKNKVQDDVEANANKQNGLKLTIPSISATVETESKSTDNSNGSNTSPNTTSTPLSRRHASEDTTLDYVYDNPAMTPSPEIA